jgi:hypothetical protein
MYSAKFGGRAGKEKKTAPKAEASTNKIKCPLCGKKGHDGDGCPKKDELTPGKVAGGEGSEINHKTSRKAGNKDKVEKVEEQDNAHHVLVVNDNPYFFWMLVATLVLRLKVSQP